MILSEITTLFEQEAPLNLQEDYDNSGLQVGDTNMLISGVLLTIDVTEKVIDEAIYHNCNLIIAHHPLIFKALKKITPTNEIQRCVIKLIKNDIALYAAHTNFDNIITGVNSKIADLLEIKNRKVLLRSKNQLLKLVTYVPALHAVRLRDELFNAGAGMIGNYSSCSFNSEGLGTFKANDDANPFVGEINKLHTEPETRIEVILPAYNKSKVVKALYNFHPYEEPAYDLLNLENESDRLGAGLVGELENAINETEFLRILKVKFGSNVIRHSNLTGKLIKKVAVCGGSGSFLLKNAIAANADIFITGDFKYHEFFDAENKILIADLGHFETEQFTKHIFYEIITKKMPTFAVRISETKTNPINYL